jgi:F-type H+-transporting ATPase subunit gamma
MASLKDLRLRIRSVKSTQKITSAMKMVAAAKLKRAQDAATIFMAQRLERMIAALASRVGGDAPPLLAGSGKDQVQLLVVASSDRGLCGAFNTAIARETRVQIRKLQAEGKTVKLLCVGRKARDILRRDYASLILDTINLNTKKNVPFSDADKIAQRVREMFAAREIDVASLVYARFQSAMTQIVTVRQIVPAALPPMSEGVADAASQMTSGGAIYEFEPDEEQILAALLPRNLSVQVYGALLENNASEQGARMTAMDNATRNAGDMIKKLTINYNRTRQAVITKELIEIISGAEAV